jgi:hypothetical protein
VDEGTTLFEARNGRSSAKEGLGIKPFFIFNSSDGIHNELPPAASSVSFLPYYYGFELGGNTNTKSRVSLCDGW